MTKEQKEQQKIDEVQTSFKNNVCAAAVLYPLFANKQITQAQRDDLLNKVDFFDAFISDCEQDYDLMQNILKIVADYAFFSAPNTSRKKTEADYALDEILYFLKALQNMEQWLKNAGRPISEAIPSSIKNLQYFFQGVADEYKIPTIAQAGKDFTNKLFDLLHNAPQKKQIKTIGSVELLKEIQSLKVAIRTLHNPAFKKTSKK
jgi:hypothetical protein